MKANVDLTLNRVFRGKREVDLEWLDRLVSPFPWEVMRRRIHSQRDLNQKKVEIFFTGDREEREHKKLNEKYEKLYTHECDCCGRYINKYPWEEIEMLCNDCSEMLERSVRKFPWAINS